MKNLKYFLFNNILRFLKYLSKKYYSVKYFIRDLFAKKKTFTPEIYKRVDVICIELTNSSDKKEGVNIFSLSNQFLPNHIKLSINGSTKEDLFDIIFQIKSLTGKKVKGVRYAVSTKEQLSNIIEIKNLSYLGDLIIHRIRPDAYQTASQVQSLIIDMPLYQFDINNKLTIAVNINPNEAINLFLTVEDI